MEKLKQTIKNLLSYTTTHKKREKFNNSLGDDCPIKVITYDQLLAYQEKEADLIETRQTLESQTEAYRQLEQRYHADTFSLSNTKDIVPQKDGLWTYQAEELIREVGKQYGAQGIYKMLELGLYLTEKRKNNQAIIPPAKTA